MEQGRVALVTGASRGIGRGIALVLAREGFDVAFTYATERREAEETARAVREGSGRRCTFHQAGLEERPVAARVVEAVLGEYGRIDVLVNNAGRTILGGIADMDEDAIDHLIGLNFRAYFLMARLVSRHMIDCGTAGHIVHITSTHGDRAYPGDALYGGLKAGINRAAQSMALDLAPYGIRVNCVAPGATAIRHTPEALEGQRVLGARIPLGRVGTEEDIGNAVAWLVSDKAAYVTGQTLRVDGGLILPGMPERKDPDTDQGWGFVWKRREKGEKA